MHDEPEAGAAAGRGAEADSAPVKRHETRARRPGRSGRLPSGCDQAADLLARWYYWHQHLERKPPQPRVKGDPPTGTSHSPGKPPSRGA